MRLLLYFYHNHAESVKKHTKSLENVTVSGPTAAFWSSFISMMNLLLAYTRVTKIGNWDMHLQSTRQMIPWFFAYDRPNYSRYVTYYLAEMEQLPETHPDIYQQFL